MRILNFRLGFCECAVTRVDIMMGEWCLFLALFEVDLKVQLDTLI